MPGRRLLVLGPMAQAVIVVALLATAVAFLYLGDAVQAGILIAAVISHLGNLLPVAKGRPTDFARVVTRRVRTPVLGVPTPIPRETSERWPSLPLPPPPPEEKKP